VRSSLKKRQRHPSRSLVASKAQSEPRLTNSRLFKHPFFWKALEEQLRLWLLRSAL
jgi:hypothetical protein